MSQEQRMSIVAHLVELRNRLIKSFVALVITTIICAIFTPRILQFLIAPYGSVLQTIDPTENVSIYFRVAIMAGAVVSMPILVYLLWGFIAPGLEDNEKKYVRIVVPGATLLFLIGV